VVVFEVQVDYHTCMSNEHKQPRKNRGYVMVYAPDHVHAYKSGDHEGWVYEHRKVASDAIGRELDRYEEVHHLDGDKSNNRANNLLVLSRGQHAKLHHWLRNGAPGIERFGVDRVNSGKAKAVTSVARCEVCGNCLQAKQKRACSRECVNVLRRKAKDRPSKAELELMLQTQSYVALGRAYGVSNNAVKKWARTYGLLG